MLPDQIWAPLRGTDGTHITGPHVKFIESEFERFPQSPVTQNQNASEHSRIQIHLVSTSALAKRSDKEAEFGETIVTISEGWIRTEATRSCYLRELIHNHHQHLNHVSSCRPQGPIF